MVANRDGAGVNVHDTDRFGAVISLSLIGLGLFIAGFALDSAWPLIASIPASVMGVYYGWAA